MTIMNRSEWWLIGQNDDKSMKMMKNQWKWWQINENDDKSMIIVENCFSPSRTPWHADGTSPLQIVGRILKAGWFSDHCSVDYHFHPAGEPYVWLRGRQYLLFLLWAKMAMVVMIRKIWGDWTSQLLWLTDHRKQQDRWGLSLLEVRYTFPLLSLLTVLEQMQHNAVRFRYVMSNYKM